MEILLDELEEIQEKYGYLPEQEIIILAEKRNMPKAELYGVITFYSRFYNKKPAKYIVRICKSISCGMNKNNIIIDSIADFIEKFQNDTDEKNKLFEMELAECLGHCDKSPVMSINDRIFENLTQDKAIEIISSYAKGGDGNV